MASNALSVGQPYPARLEVEYPEGRRNRLTVALRLLALIPIVVLLGTIPGEWLADSGNLAIAGGVLFLPVLLMLVFRQKYPRWWFDWNLEFARFTSRVVAYGSLLRDEYPATDEEQAVHLDLEYPDAARLNRWLPLVKWFLAIPHYLVLLFLFVAVLLVTVFAWVSILLTGSYPRRLFDFSVGVQRWCLRVQAYAFLLTTDAYPPFSLR